jgi:hypothetical protein
MNQMTTQEIVKHEAGEDFEKIYTKLHQLLSTPKYRLIRENNTLFLVKIIKEGVGHIYTISADDPKTILRSMLGGLKAMKKANYKEIHFDTKEKSLPVFLKNNGYTIHPLKNNVFMVKL